MYTIGKNKFTLPTDTFCATIKTTSCFRLAIIKKKINIYRRCFFEYNARNTRHRNAIIIVVFDADCIAYDTYKTLCRKADGTETRRNQSCLCYCCIIYYLATASVVKGMTTSGTDGAL